MVHAGSTGEAVVTATGAGGAVGRVSSLVQEAAQPLTPLQRRLARLGRQIAVAVAGACLLFLASGLVRGQPWGTTIVAAGGSGERWGGEEGRSRGAPDHLKKNKER